VQQLPLEGLVDKTHLPLKDKISLFGPSGIPLILPPGTKGKWDKEKGEPWHEYYRLRTGWRTRTLEDTLEESYQYKLYQTQCNVAIPQGIRTRLGAFDFDTLCPDIWEEFFEKNPMFRQNALITIGSKGFTLWILFEGDFPLEPAVIHFGAQGQVEWRTEGNYSVIHGLHPEGMFYQLWVLGRGLVPLGWMKDKITAPSPRWKEWPPLYPPQTKKRTVRLPLGESEAREWESWLHENYEANDDSDPLKWRVECPNKANHSTDTREEDTILWTGIDGTVPNFHCSHGHCQGEEFNKPESRKIQAAYFGADKLVIHQDTQKFNTEIERMYARMAASGEFFARNRSDPPLLVRWKPDMPAPVKLTANTFNAQMGAAGFSFAKFKTLKSGTFLVDVLPPREIVKQFLDHPSKLTPATQIIHSPILVDTPAGAKIVANCYVPELEAIVLGDPAEVEKLQMDLGEAKDLLLELTSYWKWVEGIDLARAYAELFTPALLAGGFIKRPVPAFLITADAPDAGKTFWHKAVGWIYGEDVDSHTFEGRTTIGGLEELLSYAIIKGDNFFFVDELSGRIKSTIINALITGSDRKTVRSAFQPMCEAMIDQLVVLLAGVKGFTLEEQFATRVIPIRINRPTSGRFNWSHAGGELLSQWIRENKLKLLAAVYAVIKKWCDLDRPANDPDSRFPSWSVGVNGVLENVLETNKVTFELTGAQKDLSNPLIAWMDEVFEEIPNIFWMPGATPYSFSINEFRNLCVNAGLGIPGTDPSIRDTTALEKNQMRVLGGKIKNLPLVGGPDEKGTSVFRLGKFFLIRYRGRNDRRGDPIYRYLFSQHNAIPVGPTEYVE
jgi:hypothetical protein